MNENTDDPPTVGRPAGSDEWATAVVEGMHDGAIAVDERRRIAFVNGAVVASLGLDRDELVGASLEGLLATEVIDRTAMNRIRTAIGRVLDRGARIATCEVPLALDGEERVLEIVWTPVDQPVTGTVGVVRDVTHRVSIGRELRERRRTIERLHETSAEIVACDTAVDVCERAVAGAEEILGLGRCAIALESGGSDGVQCGPSGVRPSSARPDSSAEPGELDDELSTTAVASATGETRLADRSSDAWAADRRACDGDALLLSPDAADAPDPCRSAAGTAAILVPLGDRGVFRAEAPSPGAFDERDRDHLELLAATVTETLRRIRVEAELREREAAMLEERDRLAALFENVPDPVVAYEFRDGEPFVRDVNAAFEETFGYDREAVLGANVDEYLVPSGAEAEADRLNAKLQAGDRLRTTAQRRTADGLRDFILNVVPTSVGESGDEGFAIYTDITEQKARQRELEHRNERLEEFASIVSHDLRNPLSVAEGFFELAVESGDSDHVERVRRAHRRMDTMIDELLTLAREGDLVGEVGAVDLAESATRAWDHVETPEASLSTPSTRTIQADDDRLVELLENCFRNAIEHAGEDVAVTVDPTDDGFAVGDDGPGVPAAERDRIFESGYTTRAAGTGYGLTIVRQVAEGHDWSIEVGESDAGGARFVFRTDG